MACAGDVPTLETLAAVDLLRAYARPQDPSRQRRRSDDAPARDASTRTASPTASSTRSSPRDKPIIFAYHGYPWLIHRLTYRRTNHDNLHVRGYKEEGTTTTPFDMVVLNDWTDSTSRWTSIDRRPRLPSGVAPCGRSFPTPGSRRSCVDTRRHGDDRRTMGGWAVALLRAWPRSWSSTRARRASSCGSSTSKERSGARFARRRLRRRARRRRPSSRPRRRRGSERRS